MATKETEKIDLILQYILTIAALEDNVFNQKLGAIHLIKYLYLADLAYAEKNNGQTYTGLKWKFHNFGPWSVEAFNRIEPACNAIGAENQILPSKYDEDINRWYLKDVDLINIIEPKIESVIKFTLKHVVHKFGSDTKALLNYVYLTKPILQAAPGEQLDFLQVAQKQYEKLQKIESELPNNMQSKKQLKRLSAKKNEFRENIQKKLAKKIQYEVSQKYSTLPRYDDVFCRGQKWLDSLAGEDISELKGEIVINPDIWKSKSRYDPDVS